MDDEGLFLLICLCVHIVLGAITAGMNTSKGYYGGFAWGFFLGIIGIIVVAVRPFNPECDRSQNVFYNQGYGNVPYNQNYGNMPYNQNYGNVPYYPNDYRFIPQGVNAGRNGYRATGYQTGGNWRCICGQTNEATATTCSCGRNKAENMANIEKVKKYKELLDMGAITQEEFETRRKEILKL